MPKILLPFLIVSLFATEALAQLRVENVVRVKGLESTTIRAVGIVSGLNGTGDDPKSFTPAALTIQRQLARSGVFISDTKGISSAKNSAMIEVTVVIPAGGARDGDTLDCTVVSVGNAKSLASGVLSPTTLSTALQQDENSLVFGIASGRISLDQTSSPNAGRVSNGCRVLADFMNPYIKEGLVTLVLKREYVRPKMANKVAEAINNDAAFGALSLQPARAVNSQNVYVKMPIAEFAAEPMDFLEKILNAEILDPPVALPKVTINERLGTVVVGVDVEVKPTLITHRNFIAEIPPGAGVEEEIPRQFRDIDTDAKFRQMNGEVVNNLKLKSLQASLDALKATQQDVIDIIKVLHAQGAIVGDVVYMD
jgi:flagellar P-ring protein precursor FlgI